MEEIYLDKDIKHDMLKLIDKMDDLEQKIININTKLKWIVGDLDSQINKKKNMGYKSPIKPK